VAQDADTPTALGDEVAGLTEEISGEQQIEIADAEAEGEPPQIEPSTATPPPAPTHTNPITMFKSYVPTVRVWFEPHVGFTLGP
jgi:hypothetical protein